MFKIEDFATKIYINLENGIYTFTDYSATGKTRLFNLLKSYKQDNLPILLYTYSDFLDNRIINPNNNYKLVLIDRYDMFRGNFEQELLELSKKAIVIVDSKEFLEFTEFDNMCGIDMTPEKIEVYG